MRSRFLLLMTIGSIVCALAACGDNVGIEIPGTSAETDTPAAETPGIGRLDPIPFVDAVDQEADPQETVVDIEPVPSQTPEEPDTKIYITISAAGDVTLGNYYEQGYWGSFQDIYNREQDPAYFFENVYDIFSADDMTIVNLEGPLTLFEERRENQTYCISGDPAYVNVLTEGSVEAVGLANNHHLDYLQQGSEDTVAALKEAGISYAYDRYAGIYETKGIRIGFVAVNEVEQYTGVEKYIQEGIAALREEGCQLVLVSCHWGTEREYYPEDYQKSLGRKCIDWGADLVVGHHPHVIQGIEEYQGKYIVYSMGNFCFGANRNPEDKDCLIVQQTFVFENGEKLEETQFRAIPCSVSSITSRNDYKPTPAKGQEARRILDRLNEYSLELGLQFDEEGYPIDAR